MRTRNGGCSGSIFSKFPVQLSCYISSGFTDFSSTFDNFMPLVFVLCQLGAILKDFMETFSVSLKCSFWSPETVHCWAVSLGGGDLSCWHDQPNKTVIESRCRCWEEKPELKLWCWGMYFCHVMLRIFLKQVVWKWFC